MEDIEKLKKNCPWCGVKVGPDFGGGCMTAFSHNYQYNSIGETVFDLNIFINSETYVFTYFISNGKWGLTTFNNHKFWEIYNGEYSRWFLNIDNIKTYINMIGLLK
jgi:hypothetical protein